MSKIHDAVVELRRAPGVRGAAVLTNDGLMAASSLDDAIGADVVAISCDTVHCHYSW